MTFKKTLTTIVLAGTIALSGCSRDNSEYNYKGKIGKDYVEFTEKIAPFFGGLNYDDNILIITKPNGDVIKYIDRDEDLKIEYVEITKKEGETIRYTKKNEVGKTILKEAQRQFESYLQQIKKAKIEQSLENLK